MGCNEQHLEGLRCTERASCFTGLTQPRQAEGISPSPSIQNNLTWVHTAPDPETDLGAQRMTVCNHFLSCRMLFSDKDFLGSGKYRKRSRFGEVGTEGSFQGADRRLWRDVQLKTSLNRWGRKSAGSRGQLLMAAIASAKVEAEMTARFDPAAGANGVVRTYR